MDKENAKSLIRNLFEQPFSKEKFIYFIKNLLNHITDDTFIYRGNYIPEIYRGYIRTIERIGKYVDQNEKKIDILIVTLEKETTLERARTLQRNIIAWYLNGSRGGQLKDAALVAFVSPNNNDWRFSYVKMEYKFVKTDKGTVKVKEELTPAKRYSFLVGPNEASHTAQSQMVPTLINDKIDPTLEEIEKIFNIETVSKEFFEKYRSLYEMLVKELNNNNTFKNEASKNNINTSNFAKKLLGQIVFLYFLQKKGWLGVEKGKSWGDGDKFFLSHLFKDCVEKNKNYFNDYLEKLFYDTLNNPRSDKVDRNYSDFFESKIPFLNGGLFEPLYNWKESNIDLDNRIFEKIFDVFDLYNFTVKEDEPLEKDVAVDPEMLGKVFENLLEENLRKGKGTYYTPREIVHYMCQESLINYLQTSTNTDEQIARKLVLVDKTINPAIDLKKQIKEKSLVLSDQQVKEFDRALNDITVCDPACGSGAFLVGMLQLIVSTKNKINGYKRLFEMNIEDKTEYDLKKRTIQNSIYGVDIDQGAVEIAKLRLWLSLVVDYNLEDIEPLPNLDYKIMVGNSLVEKFDINRLEKTMDDEKNKLIDDVKNLKEKYFETSELKTKTNLRYQINETIRLLINYDNKQERERIKTQFTDKKNQMKMFLYDGEQQSFDDIKTIAILETFKDIKETDHFEWHINFNEVFEKGGFDVVIANPPYIDSENMVQSGLDDIRKVIQKTYKWTKGNWDIYIAFFELGFKKLNPTGTLTFITPDKWISKPFGNEFRIGTIDNLYTLLRAGRKVFQSAKVDSIISIFAKQEHEKLKIIDFINGKFILIREINKKSLQKPYTLDHLFSAHLDLLVKIEKLTNKISDLSEVQNACATSDAYKLAPLIFDLKSNSFNSTKQFKIVNTGTIDKYHSKWGKKEMTYLGHKYLFPVVDKNTFINAFKNSYASKSIKSKILIKGLNLLDGCLDEEGSIIPGKTTLIITNKDINKLKLLLAVINNKFSIFYIKERYPASSYNQGTSFTKEMISNLPIPEISNTEIKVIIELVNKILSLTKSKDYLQNSSIQTQVKEYEKQIDQMVYKLYGLTEEEIKIIEGKDKGQ